MYAYTLEEGPTISVKILRLAFGRRAQAQPAPGPVAIRLTSANREDRAVPFLRRLISILSRKRSIEMAAFGAFGRVREGLLYRRDAEERCENTP